MIAQSAIFSRKNVAQRKQKFARFLSQKLGKHFAREDAKLANAVFTIYSFIAESILLQIPLNQLREAEIISFTHGVNVCTILGLNLKHHVQFNFIVSGPYPFNPKRRVEGGGSESTK